MDKRYWVMSENPEGGWNICWGSFDTEEEAWIHATNVGYREGVNCWVEVD